MTEQVAKEDTPKVQEGQAEEETKQVVEQAEEQTIQQTMLQSMGDTKQMTEYEKRLARAQRFGLDPNQVVTKPSVNFD